MKSIEVTKEKTVQSWMLDFSQVSKYIMAVSNRKTEQIIIRDAISVDLHSGISFSSTYAFKNQKKYFNFQHFIYLF